MTACLKNALARWPYPAVSVLAALSAFGLYTCMYAFRKAFAAGTYNGQEFLGADYKVWLVIAQVAGYTLSKFYGIRYIAENGHQHRARKILVLITISWLALLGFAIVPRPFNIVFLFINGFPLGMIWGLVFSYLEGRKATEFMAAVLSVSLIFASGFVKTIGRMVLDGWNVNEYWMPFVTGLVFIAPLLLFVMMLEAVPSPTAGDVRSRAKRVSMNAAERKQFLFRFLPGITLTVIIYLFLTMMRDVRDNFEVEIYAGLGVSNNSVYSATDTLIAILVLVGMALLILIKNNLRAFSIIHVCIIAGCLLTGFSTVLFNNGSIGPVMWMILAGLGLYLAYIPYNAIFFERMIASFQYKSNVGFVMYMADAIGYLGSVSILLIKEFGNPALSWTEFFRQGALVVSVVCTAGGVLSMMYFLQKAKPKASEYQLSPS